MSAIDEEPTNVERNNDTENHFTEEPTCAPQQLAEIEELLASIDRRLEECALEWQAQVSRDQWKVFNSNGAVEKYILARTYFPEKDLDQAFQHLLSCNKIFAEYFKNFMGLLQGQKQTFSSDGGTQDAQNQYPDNGENSHSEPHQVSLIANRCSNKAGKIKNLINNISSVQNSFGDVIKAKVNFDTKFLGFEAVLHKKASASVDSACVCQYCYNITRSPRGDRKKLRNLKKKRLTRSKRTLYKKKGKKTSLMITDIGERPSVDVNRNYNDSVVL